MAFHPGRAGEVEHQLRRDFGDFSRLWRQVREDWRDQRCERFEQQHLASLGPSLSRLSAALGELCELTRKAEHALEDESRRASELE